MHLVDGSWSLGDSSGSILFRDFFFFFFEEPIWDIYIYIYIEDNQSEILNQHKCTLFNYGFPCQHKIPLPFFFFSSIVILSFILIFWNIKKKKKKKKLDIKYKQTFYILNKKESLSM